MKLIAGMVVAAIAIFAALFSYAMWQVAQGQDPHWTPSEPDAVDPGLPDAGWIAGLGLVTAVRLPPTPWPPASTRGRKVVVTVDVPLPHAPGAGTCSRWAAEVIAGEHLRLADEGRSSRRVRGLVVRRVDDQGRVRARTRVSLPGSARVVTEDGDADDGNATTPLTDRAEELGLRVRLVTTGSQGGVRTAVLDLRSPDVATADAAFEELTAPELMPESAAAGGRCLQISLEDGRLLYAHGTVPRLGREIVWRHPG